MDTKQLKAKILDLAVHGKLLPLETLSELKNSPDYEPASKLLEKLRAEKEEKIKAGELKRDKKDSYIFTGDDNRHYEKFADGSVKDIEDEIPFEEPDGWAWCRLGEIFTHSTGKALKKSNSNGTLRKYITTSNLYWDSFDFTEIRSMYFTDEELDKCTAKKGDLLVCNGGDVGRAAIWNFDYDICYQNHISRLRPKVNKIDNKFYFYVIWINKEKGNLTGKGIGITSLSASDLLNLCIPLPPISEQNRIVSELERIFSLIDSLENDKSALQLAVKQAKSKILDLAIHGKLVLQDPADEPASVLLEKLRAEKEAKIAKGELKRDKNDSYIYKSTTDNCHYEKFADGSVKNIEDEIPFEVPDGWAWCRLGEISSKLKRGKSPKYIEKSSIMAFAQKCNQKDGPTTLEKALYIDESTLKKYAEEEKMQFNDIVINSTGTGTLGRVGIFDCNIPDDIVAVYPDSHVSSVRINSELFAKYFYYFVKSKQSYLETMGEGSTNQKELKIDTIANLKVPLPPISEQKRIVSKIEELFEALDKIQSNLI